PPGSAASAPWPLLCLFGAMMLGGLNYRCLVTALPPFLSGNRAAAQDLAEAGWYLFFALLAGGVGQFCGGHAADRFGARRIYPILIGMLAVYAALLGSLEGNLAAPAVAGLVAVVLFAQQPIENSLLAELTTARRRRLSSGWKFAL